MGTALRRSRRWGDVSGLKTVIVIGLTAATEEVRLHLKCQTVKLLMFLGYRHSYTKIAFWSGLLGAPVLFDQGPTVRTQPQETLINDLSLKPSYRKKFWGPCGLIAMVNPGGTPGPCIEASDPFKGASRYCPPSENAMCKLRSLNANNN